MARKEKKIIIIGNNTYYTSSYFADKVALNKRSARDFLNTYPHLTGSKNPKLYSEKIINKALDDYETKVSAKNIEKRLQTQSKEREQARANSEWNNFASYQDELQKILKEHSDLDEVSKRMQQEAYDNAQDKFNKELVPRMLQGLYHLLKHSFDVEQFKQDCLIYEDLQLRQIAGEEREIDEIQAVERLADNIDYIKKK